MRNRTIERLTTRKLAAGKLVLLLAVFLQLSVQSPLTHAALGTTLTPVIPPRQAPPLALKNLDNQTTSLAALRGKKVVLINFWATWCPPCREEMPSIQRLWSQLKGDQFEVLAVDAGEDSNTATQYIGTLEIPLGFPILVDTTFTTMRNWKVMGLPASYLIDKRGQIVYSALGGRKMDSPAIVALIKKLMLAN